MKKSALIVLLTLLSIPLHAADVSDLSYDASGDTITITDCDNAASGEFIIPSVIEGKPVVSIGYAAFRGCARLTNITIPDSVTNIGESAFEACTNLVNITIGESVTSIERFAFYRCLNLSSITIPNRVTSIRDNAFRLCASLTNITLPESLTNIDDGAFFGCTSLKDITIPDSITSISIGVFADCTSLSSITIPDSVTSIGSVVFSGCTSLSSVTIGNGVISIGARAFSGCTSLTGITFRGNAPTIGVDLFDFVPANAKVFIYEGASGFGGRFGGFSVVVQKNPFIGDTDKDGWKDETEVLFGSSPDNAKSVPAFKLELNVLEGDQLELLFPGEKGTRYVVQTSDDMKTWLTLTKLIIGQGKTVSERFSISGGLGFYRIQRE